MQPDVEGIESCPKCKVNLRYVERGRVYSTALGMTVQGSFDGVLFWQCPACKHRWHRWAPGSRLRALAEQHIGEPK